MVENFMTDLNKTGVDKIDKLRENERRDLKHAETDEPLLPAARHGTIKISVFIGRFLKVIVIIDNQPMPILLLRLILSNYSNVSLFLSSLTITKR